MTKETSRLALTLPARTLEWWTAMHGSALDRVQEAAERDQEQVKADLMSSGVVNRNVGETAQRASGDAQTPPGGVEADSADPEDDDVTLR